MDGKRWINGRIMKKVINIDVQSRRCEDGRRNNGKRWMEIDF